MNTCLVCQKEFEYHKAPGHPKNFCSFACRGVARRDLGKRIVAQCVLCGKDFSEWSYRKARFCSRLCQANWIARLPRKPRKGHLVLTCQFCGKSYHTKEAQVRWRGSRFCSRECKDGMDSIEKRGAGNPNWKGGLPFLYGPNWTRQSKAAKRRDKGCRACGYQAGGKRILDVHHIVPLKHFGDDYDQANRLSNLISLCRPCHCLVESGRLACPTVPRRDTEGTRA